MSPDRRPPLQSLPCHVVFFASSLREGDMSEYHETADRMFRLVESIPGYLGCLHHESRAWGSITNSFWTGVESIARWRDHPEHGEARRRGLEEWYADCRLLTQRISDAEGYFRICEAEFGVRVR